VCDIAGEIAFHGRRAQRAPVGRMSQSMGDRGPGGERVWDQGWVTLAHRRLTIIDLCEAGHQPMTDVQLGLTIVFNGCIDNQDAGLADP
jgi:asparagine synthase (glutamine-hydrolysing)